MTDGAQTPLLIYTDASFDGKSRTGSWGAVVRKGQHEIHLQGLFRLTCYDSTTAELQAIGNAIHKARDLAAPGELIVIYSDCQPAVHALSGRGRFRPSREQLVATLKAVQAICDQSGCRFKFHWIKGHQPQTITTPHATGNRMADKLARQAHEKLEARREIARSRRKRYKANRKARLARAREDARIEAATADAIEGTQAVIASAMDQLVERA